jgi:ABC-type molybdate transport system substrate-binding protein
MDRISALRNVEDALAEFERGEIDLAELRRQVGAVLGTYATDFDAGEQVTYRVEAADRDPPVVVVAASPAEARQRAVETAGVDPVSVERLSSTPGHE